MQVQFEKAGDHLVVSIPEPVVTASNIQPGSLADLTLADGKPVARLATPPGRVLGRGTGHCEGAEMWITARP